jgi:UDP-N-acetylmuramoyl-tripeptide--D-alanyl-D-alanine ligase
MAEFTLSQIVTAVNGVLLQGDPAQALRGVTTDSRQLRPGELFLALKGERFDGHNFLASAIEAGAGAVMVTEDVTINKKIAVIKVADTQEAFGRIARFHRDRFSIPVVGITGSNGKTTTKDLVTAVLSGRFSVVSTVGNFNNEIGLPLTLLRLSEQTQVAVVEMGMRGLGQIKELAGIAKPNIALITNVGLTHLELLGTQGNIAKAKQELVEALPDDGLAILNGDDPLVRRMQTVTNAKTLFFGIEGPELDCRAGEIEFQENGSSFTVHFKGETFDLAIPLPGRHNILNTLAAVTLGKELGISNEVIRQSLAAPSLTGKRLNMITKNGYRIIDDTYNASPTSVKASLDVLSETGNPRRRIAVLADMLELGPDSVAIHHQIGEYAGTVGIDHLFAFGVFAREYVSGINGISEGKGEYFSTKLALIAELKQFIQPGDTVLVKGSRGMKMEEIVEALCGEGVSV